MEEIDNAILLSNLQSYLESNGIDTTKNFHCINPNHVDKNASMKYFDDGRVYCFGCRTTYNLIGAIGAIEGLNNKEAYKKAIEYYGNKMQVSSNFIKRDKYEKRVSKDYSKALNFWHKNLKESQIAKDYLMSRKISEYTANKFGLGFNTFDFGKYKFNAIVIPNKTAFTARNISPEITELRYYKPKGCKSSLFNEEALTNDIPYCFITEGEFDCMSFDTIGINAIGLSSVNNLQKFKDYPKTKEKTYIISLDNDEAGKKASEELIDYFRNENMNFYVFDNCGYKDANQALVSDYCKFSEVVNDVVKDIEKEKERIEKKLKQHNAEM